MREILFRGKRISNGKWVYGDFLHLPHGVVILTNGYANVIPETIGQFTGLTDKNGVKIFEGDIVKVPYFKISFEVKFVKERARFLGEAHNGELISLLHSHKDIEIIGNIWDNPELLKGE